MHTAETLLSQACEYFFENVSSDKFLASSEWKDDYKQLYKHQPFKSCLYYRNSAATVSLASLWNSSISSFNNMS